MNFFKSELLSTAGFQATEVMKRPTDTRKPPATSVVTTGLDALLERLAQRPARVWLASPFLGHEVGCLLADELEVLHEAGITTEIRVLTCLTEAGLRSGYTDPRAVRAFLGALPSGQVRTLANLHAKVCIVDDWALIGSGNLSASGLDGLNAEIGVCTTDPLVVDGALESLAKWWDRAVKVRREHLKGRRVARRPQGIGLARGAVPLPSRRAPSKPGLALARWKRDRAVMQLQRVLDGERKPLPDPARRLSRRRSAAYRACQQLADGGPQTRELLCRVLAKHPVADARVHAAWRLTTGLAAGTLEEPTLQVLLAAYRNDPALTVRRNASRALQRLRRSGHITVDGLVREPRSPSEQPPLATIARIDHRAPRRHGQEA